LAALRGAKVRFLAPYCPIDNPIEPAFNVFKMHWTRYASMYNSVPPHVAIRHALFGCYKDPAGSAVKAYRSYGYL
jgi:hypothetical protein